MLLINDWAKAGSAFYVRNFLSNSAGRMTGFSSIKLFVHHIFTFRGLTFWDQPKRGFILNFSVFYQRILGMLEKIQDIN